ncbi:MAG: hypothetical protein E7518_11405 [Ruminococcaceae bacterium]|nr:hypothetical protein [Oscillospiraceae bacterium]
MVEKPMKVKKVKCCYGHLGGKLGDLLFDRMLELGWIQKDPEEARKFALTDLGIREFLKLGVNPYDA